MANKRSMEVAKGVSTQDTSDKTKQLALEVGSGSTTGTKTTVTSAQTADRTITLPDATDTLVALAATQILSNKTYTNPVLNGSITGTGVLDEDDMTSDSAVALATQQSIKAYVDAQVTAQDLDLTTDSGTIAIDLDSETLTIAGGS